MLSLTTKERRITMKPKFFAFVFVLIFVPIHVFGQTAPKTPPAGSQGNRTTMIHTYSYVGSSDDRGDLKSGYLHEVKYQSHFLLYLVFVDPSFGGQIQKVLILGFKDSISEGTSSYDGHTAGNYEKATYKRTLKIGFWPISANNRDAVKDWLANNEKSTKGTKIEFVE